MVDFNLPETFSVGAIAVWFVSGVLTGLGGLALWLSLPNVIRSLKHQTVARVPPEVKAVYNAVFRPYQAWLGTLLGLSIFDRFLWLLQWRSFWLDLAELLLSIGIGVGICLVGFQVFQQFFDVYMLNLAIRSKRKANSEVLLLYKYIANAGIVLVVIFIFAQAHAVNLVGLLASLGVGGIAVALAAQKVLEQVLWSTMIYLDRPFVVDDYIHLNDGTFGRVEAIGWRSTKIRLSGKSTLVVIPNSILAQMAIENLSGAQKVISLINVTFYQDIPAEERALIRQIILGSTKDIYGLDHRLTEVVFSEVENDHNEHSTAVQAQVTFFILGSGEVSMEVRSQLLAIARQKVMQQLKGYGLAFDIEERTTNITSPMNI